ncbi:MAG TPA: PfkB family carbohydrate kinase [Candidatus Udaeobacter sp.]|jgi:1-phosphofructokinase family hexose kinase
MRKIYAIALNTAVDMSMRISDFTYGKIIRSLEYKEYAAGKAVNSCRAIACLDQKSLLYCFSGETDLDLFSKISPFIKVSAFEGQGVTRRNLTLVTQENELVCHIQNQGYTVSSELLQTLEKKLFQNIKKDDVVIVSGSMPSGVPSNYLHGLLSRLAKVGVQIILDCDPILLGFVAGVKVTLAKPNREELSRLASKELLTTQDIVSAAVELFNSSIIVVSLGADGAIWINKDKRYFQSGKISVRSNEAITDPIGCGDSMVGGFALGLARSESDEKMLKMGLAAGYANLFVPGPGTLTPIDYERGISTAVIDTPVALREEG